MSMQPFWLALRVLLAFVVLLTLSVAPSADPPYSYDDASYDYDRGSRDSESTRFPTRTVATTLPATIHERTPLG
jgi:hypothetical protein